MEDWDDVVADEEMVVVVRVPAVVNVEVVKVGEVEVEG